VLSPSEDWEAIVSFCDRINKSPDGPQTALKLLVHKIQSPQEKESLLALLVSKPFEANFEINTILFKNVTAQILTLIFCYTHQPNS